MVELLFVRLLRGKEAFWSVGIYMELRLAWKRMDVL